jgi:hypothetical protein
MTSTTLDVSDGDWAASYNATKGCVLYSRRYDCHMTGLSRDFRTFETVAAVLAYASQGP